MVDVQSQIDVLEFLFRLSPKSIPDKKKFISNLSLHELFLELKSQCFEENVRAYLNHVNRNHDGVRNFPLSIQYQQLDYCFDNNPSHVPMINQVCYKKRACSC